jgi:N-acyl-D-aspartate/D-glutamate deacylase
MTTKWVTRIDELPQSVAPERDLWPGIAAAIEADRSAVSQTAPARRRVWVPAAGMAAAIALVAIGMVIGMRLQPAPPPTAGIVAPSQDVNLIPAAMRDQKYRAQRDALMVEVQNRLQAMAPADRDKVKASLDTLKKSIADIEAALGHDPANALLQELLVSSCQEEMRALTAVRDSGSQEI